MGVNASHYSGPHHVLFEGNWGDNLDNDDTHGNSMYITFFRNQGTGLRTPFTDPSLNKAVNDYEGIGYACGDGAAGCSPNPPGPLRAAGPMAYNYWFGFVGNVLGTARETTSANGWTYQGDWSVQPYMDARLERSANGRQKIHTLTERLLPTSFGMATTTMSTARSPTGLLDTRTRYRIPSI